MTLTPRRDVNVEYLRHYFGSEAGVARLASASPGSAGRNRTLSIRNLEQIVTPLPSRRVHDRIAGYLDDLSGSRPSGPESQLLQLLQRDWPGDQLTVSDLVEPISRREQPMADGTYLMQGVRWYGEGLFTRETRTGSDLTGAVYRIEPGDLVYNRLFALKQSFALAVSAGHASNEFPTFKIRADRVRPRVLLAALLSPAFTEAVNSASTGSTPTSRNRLKERDFLALPVTIPPSAAQPAIEAALKLIDRIKPLTRHADALASAILPAARNEIFNSCAGA